MLRYLSIGLIALSLTTSAMATQTTIRASKPTHYFYVPTAYLNKPDNMVASLHEISYALPANLQLQMSIFDNIGRINFGARYGFQDNLSIGAGLAYSFVSSPYGGHGIRWGNPARLGIFLAWGLLQSNTLELCLVPHTQIGSNFSLGADFGLKFTPVDFWSLIWEFGTSADLYDGKFYINTDGGIRIHPPTIPFLNFDLGVDLVETAVDYYHPGAALYFDVIFSFVAR